LYKIFSMPPVIDDATAPSAPGARPRGPAPARASVWLSEWLLRAERAVVMALMALLFGLILLNVASRYGGFPIFWVDEAAIYAVVWLTFIGASAMSRLRLDFAVTMLTGAVSPAAARWLQRAAALANLLFVLALAAMCAWWLDPAGFAEAGFDAKAFAAQSFNFLYTERTQALGWPTWVFYLVMPLYALCAAVHALANLVEDLGWVDRIERAPLGGHAEA